MQSFEGTPFLKEPVKGVTFYIFAKVTPLTDDFPSLLERIVDRHLTKQYRIHSIPPAGILCILYHNFLNYFFFTVILYSFSVVFYNCRLRSER